MCGTYEHTRRMYENLFRDSVNSATTILLVETFTRWVTVAQAAEWDPISLHCNATHCSTLQYTAVHCNTLHHTASHCSTPQRTATHCNALQHTAWYHEELSGTLFHDSFWLGLFFMTERNSFSWVFFKTLFSGVGLIFFFIAVFLLPFLFHDIWFFHWPSFMNYLFLMTVFLELSETLFQASLSLSHDSFNIANYHRANRASSKATRLFLIE